MKTYNLISGSLFDSRRGQECYCALGIYAKEKVGTVETSQQTYDLFRRPEYQDDLEKMADLLYPLASGKPWDSYWTQAYEAVYQANDETERHEDGRTVRYEPVVPAEKIQEALALVGINVQLNDLRAQEYTHDY